MASLIDNLIEILNRECEAYEELAELSEKKTPVIVRGDLDLLQQITDDEQVVAGRINRIDAERRGIMKEIADVLNTDVETLKLTDLLRVLERRPEERQKLAVACDKVKLVTGRMKRVNEHNRELIESALEAARFELNLIQAAQSAPETANYTRGAYSDGSVIGDGRGRFDAKQ